MIVFNDKTAGRLCGSMCYFLPYEFIAETDKPRVYQEVVPGKCKFYSNVPKVYAFHDQTSSFFWFCRDMYSDSTWFTGVYADWSVSYRAYCRFFDDNNGLFGELWLLS
ncbi:MAG: hypothetical protein JW920_06650 [Deltaproteobacteria bacterium]|nr:hypothetical protein [Deltaproteobacteria bacterium]